MYLKKPAPYCIFQRLFLINYSIRFAIKNHFFFIVFDNKIDFINHLLFSIWGIFTNLNAILIKKTMIFSCSNYQFSPEYLLYILNYTDIILKIALFVYK